jgi:hypothetical protein
MSTKLSDLTEATVVDSANDFLLLTDVSDTTMAPSGTTKKVNPDKLPIPILVQAEIDTKLDTTSASKTTYHTAPATTGPVTNGDLIDSGDTLVVTGSGAATVVSNAAGYIHNPTSPYNTYLMVDSGSPIKRVVQHYQGLHGVIAIGLVISPVPTDMIHMEFNSGTSAACTYWKTGVGVAQQLTIAESVAAVPNLNDGVSHELAVEVDGDFVTAFVDGVCVGFWWDANVSTVTGNWYYTQIDDTTANAKVYGFSSYDTIPQSFTGKFGTIFAAMVQAQGFQFGRSSLAGFAPTSPYYIYTEGGDIVHLVGSTNAKFMAEADGAGHPAYFIAKNAIDVELYVGVGASDGVMNYQGNNVITCPVNGYVSDLYMHLKRFSTDGIMVGVSTGGAVELVKTAAGRKGYVAWLKEGVRHGYMGFDTDLDITLTLEGGKFNIVGGNFKPTLPTSNPGPGILWNDSGTVKVGT